MVLLLMMLVIYLVIYSEDLDLEEWEEDLEVGVLRKLLIFLFSYNYHCKISTEAKLRN